MRLIDADGLKELLKEYCIDGDKEIKEYYEIMGIDDCVDKAPTVEAVEVVRCKDCKYFVKGRDWFSCQKWYMDIRKDDYCSYGERKENVD